jgi:putative endopeptidase
MNKLTSLITVPSLLFMVIGCSSSEEKEPVIEKDIIPAFDISQIDSSHSACDDFEQFAAGNWLKNNPIPESESRWGSFNVLNDQNEIQLKTIVDEAAKAKAKKGTTMQLVGDFYTSALDSTTASKLGYEPIKPYLNKINKAATLADLISTSVENKKIGSGSFFSYYVYIDSKNSEKYITYLTQGGLGLPDKSYYFPKDERGENILAEYEKFITKLFVLTDNSEEVAVQKAKNIIKIETELASNSMDRVDLRDPHKTYHKMDKAGLQKLTSIINWNDFFATAEFKDFDTLIVRQPDFFKALNNTLKKFPLEDWKDYVSYHFINDFSGDLSIAFEQANFDFYSTTLNGVKEMKPRWKRALSKSNGTVGESLGKLFVEKHFPEESKQMVLDMINNISAVFKERVQQLDWMSEETKIKALEKLSKFNYKIGYPDKWKDYSSVDIQPNTLVQNVINMNYFEYKENIDKLGKPIDKDEWGMNPQRINAYYSSTMNEIVFPAAILQPPFFNPEADDAINYGGIGAVIGHEFSHGFDDQGSKSDGDGNLNNWWTDEDKANFAERTGKLAAQYDKYEVAEGNKVNGKLTLGENIADIAGITLAYYGLQKAVEKKGKPALIDGFDYNQRFFLGWAQVWHTNAKDEFLINQVKTDPHSPTRYRINGPLVNMKEFHAAFSCKEGHMVAPDSLRVTIW